MKYELLTAVLSVCMHRYSGSNRTHLSDLRLKDASTLLCSERSKCCYTVHTQHLWVHSICSAAHSVGMCIVSFTLPAIAAPAVKAVALACTDAQGVLVHNTAVLLLSTCK
jgi:hypothetical protein